MAFHWARPEIATTFLAACLAACGEDAAAPADAAPGDDGISADSAPGRDGEGDPSAFGPLTAVTGAVQLREDPYGSAIVWFADRAPEDRHELVASEGACRLYLPLEPAFCDPACAGDEECTRSGCTPLAAALSAGRVTIRGPGWTATADPEPDGRYVVSRLPSGSLFEAGASLSVTAEGAEEPAFDVELAGVDDMETAWTELALHDGMDNEVTWTPRDDGALVELVLQTGWHGAPPEGILWCATSDTGRLVLPRALVEAFPPAGGGGLFPVDSFIRRVSRRLVPSSTGVVEISAASHRSFWLIH